MFLLLCLHWAPAQSHHWPSQPSPGQLADNGCHPTSQRPGQAPQQRPLFGQWPPSFHGEPIGTLWPTHGQGVALPDGHKGLELNMRPLVTVKP